MQIRRNLLIGFAVIMLMVSVGCEKENPSTFSCTDAIGCVKIAPGGPIKIAALQTLSGEVVKALGINQIRGAELAIAARDGKILGHPVALQRLDAMCSKEGGRTGAQRIVSDPKIVAVFGTTCSGAAVPALKIISEAGLTMVSGASTAPSLTALNGTKGKDYHPGFFRFSHNDEIQGRVAAVFAYKALAKRKAATIHDGDTYTKGLVQVFQREFENLGGEMVLATGVNKSDTDMRPVLRAVAESGAEFVFFPLFQPAGDYITKQARKMRAFDSIALMVADALFHKAFISSVAQDGKGMYFVGPAKPKGPKYDAMVAQYKDRYNEAPFDVFHANAYDAVDMLLKTIERIAVQDKDGSLYIGRQTLRDALHEISGYEGLTGTLHCSEYGDCGVPRIKVVRLDDPAAGFEGLTANIQYLYTPMAAN